MNSRMLKAKMIERNKNAKQMAKLCGMSLSSWYHKVSGISPFMLNEVKTVAQELNLTPREFFNIFLPELFIKEGRK